jgi:very-short-patch-repair endonuclease
LFGAKADLDRHIKVIHDNPKPKAMSRGEALVKDVIIDLGLEFVREKSFPELVGLNGGLLRYDFCIVIDELEQDYLLIEFDGRQHYKKVKWQNNWTEEQITEKFKQTKRHDRIKNKFANLHNYPLLRIKYDQVKDVKQLVTEFIKEHSNLL